MIFDTITNVLKYIEELPVPLCIICAGFIWGATNPLLSYTSKPSPDSNDQYSNQFYKILHYIIIWIPFAIVFGINQLGSLFNLLLLRHGDLSMVSPMTNTIAFFVTALVEVIFIGNRVLTWKLLSSLLLISFGTYLALTK